MKMRNRNEAPAAILANVEVFDYLKEKVGERKTRTEAYCDLLDKSLAGFVSPFLRRQDYDLSPCQCHVTVSDLASEWHWHRATVRSFLDTLEALGQLERIRLAKSVVITMPLRTGTPAMPDSGQEEADFVRLDNRQSNLFRCGQVMWTNHAPDLDGYSRTGQSYLSGQSFRHGIGTDRPVGRTTV